MTAPLGKSYSTPSLLCLGANPPREGSQHRKVTLDLSRNGPIDKQASLTSEKAWAMASMLKTPSWRWKAEGVERPVREQPAEDRTHRNMRLPRLAPAWLKHEKQCLRFYAYFQETVTERWDENCRYRHVIITLHMEDGTMSVCEPKIENSGIPQGQFLKRQQVRRANGKGFIDMNDLRVRSDITFNGVTYHIVGCDSFTRWYYEENGMEQPEDDRPAQDQWQKSYTFMKVAEKGGLPMSRSAVEAKHLTLFKVGQPPADLRLIQFLQNDRKVLRFKAYWDDPTPYGNRIYFTVHYYLSNNTVEINEAHARNSGRDGYPVFYKRAPLYKETRVNAYPGMLEPLTAAYEPQDMLVGQSFNVWGRKIVLYDCDDFTQKFYEEHVGIDQKASCIDVTTPPVQHTKLMPPPHNGVGYPEDSLQNCLMVQPKAAKKDLARLMTLSGEVLRFEAKMINGEPEDENRKFLIGYFPADEQVACWELAVRNSGHMGGKFQEKKRYTNPRTGRYFELSEMAVGSVVILAAQPFLITRADEHTLQYLERNADQFDFANPMYCASLLRPILDRPEMQDEYGVDPDVLKEIASQHGVDLIDHEIITLLRHFNCAPEGGQPAISGPRIIEALSGNY
eukprot:TRINITY_DN36997_c0_g1_i1.p1 TRINITY_DN36997_c0_g1~~TRINITY_DN36997_c0_g1_i1.p1  ORF type:complete len:621 (-),score=133.06 TRINITY_DN36997_c0_g1_i1:88-1950(-)